MTYCSQNIRRNSAIAFCIDSYRNYNIQGRAYCGDDREPVLFREINTALIHLDERLDQYGGPQASTQRRVFRKRRRHLAEMSQTARQRREESFMAETQTFAPQGNLATFLVQVEYRQNSTWQGNVVWVDKNEKKSFRSALELLMLMNSALEDEEKEKDLTFSTE